MLRQLGLCAFLFIVLAGGANAFALDATPEQKKAGESLRKDSLRAAAGYVRELQMSIRGVRSVQERQIIEERLSEARRTQQTLRNMNVEDFVEKAIEGATADELIGKSPPATPLTFSDLAVGKRGYLTFPPTAGTKLTLLPLKTADVEQGQFIGTAGIKNAVIVRGVDTTGLVSEKYVQLAGEIAVTGTEEVSDGRTVFILEPTDPQNFELRPSNSPELERPVGPGAGGPANVGDIRGR